MRTAYFILILLSVIATASSEPRFIISNFTLDNGLVAYYSFDDGTARDVSGNGNDGTIEGAIVSDGKINQALYFDGINDYVDIPRSIQDSFSIVFWVNTTQTGGSGQWWAGNGLVDADQCDITDDFGVSLLGSKASFGVGSRSPQIDTTIQSVKNINDDNWHQIAATRKKETGEIKLYVDGSLETSGMGKSNSLTAPPYIGIGNEPCNVYHDRRWFNGAIDEVRIYGRELGAEEILSLYNQGNDVYNDLKFVDLKIYPDQGTNLIANKKAVIKLFMKNEGNNQIPGRQWKLETDFVDVRGWIVQRRDDWIVDIPTLTPASENLPGSVYTTSKEITLSMDQSKGDCYLPFADQLRVFGSPSNQEINYYSKDHFAYQNVSIGAETSCNGALCVWNTVKVFLDVFLVKYLKLVYASGGANWAILAAKLHLYVFDLGITMPCTNGAERTGAFITKSLTAVASAGFSITDLTIDLFNFFGAKDFWDAVKYCSEFIMDVIRYVAETLGYYGPKADIWIFQHGTEIIVTNQEGQMIHMNNGSIINEIPNSSAFYIDDGEIIVVPQDTLLDLKIKFNQSSIFELTSVTPTESNNSMYQHFKIPTYNGTILTSSYIPTNRQNLINVDLDGNGKIEYLALPDLIKKGDLIESIQVDKTIVPNSAASGELIDFTLNITNTGTVNLSSVKAIDSLPSDLIYISDNRSGAIIGKTITWNDLGFLNAGDSIFINLFARIDNGATGRLINKVSVIGSHVPEGYNVTSLDEEYVDVRELKVKQNVERMKIGDQVVMATGNGRATNNIRIVSN
ncbi:MAG: LamG domain-containing protein [Methanothrix sp.]|nr:LamG domain-containing protein [Methanothrix sp.]